jgi:hypothetical protein
VIDAATGAVDLEATEQTRAALSGSAVIDA